MPKINRLDTAGRVCTNVHMTRKPDFVTRTEPIAFFLTWTTYGSWLPGDDRGWTDSRGHLRVAEPARTLQASRLLAECPLALGAHQQSMVEDVIAAHCKFRGWTLHAVSCRPQHVHVVVTAVGVSPEDVLTQFKVWATRRLKAASADDRIPSSRRRWWSECGSKRWIYDVEGMGAVVTYVTECQDKPRS
jgi:REP element-mobilizing transposase RayT